ncbi:MAG: hypothetical protein IT518_26255 [Burkholderiales bacterium]|nr:hypothetical protein [Burkholderiales bacterium]
MRRRDRLDARVPLAVDPANDSALAHVPCDPALDTGSSVIPLLLAISIVNFRFSEIVFDN